MGVNKAIKDGKLRCIKKIGKASQWQAAAWMLERKWGKEFRRKDHQQVNASVKVTHIDSQQEQIRRILKDEEASELASALARRLAYSPSGNGQSAN